jgi:predicted transcriptional regulator
MLMNKMERRANTHCNSNGEKFDEAVIREGVLLQRALNTVTAIEFLKNRGVSAATIQRVLSGQHLRQEDRSAIAERSARQ